VHYIVTEYGVADLHAKTIRQRVQALVNVAAPQFREELLHFAKEQHWI
jgi:acyl-CoA hydrolase